MIRRHYLIPDVAFASYEEYREATGEDAVAKARELDPEEVVQEVRRGGLRGRGGAGFPTGVKWDGLRRHPCPTKHVVCNAAEGEPGTFKDRWVLRKNPYALVEGLLIAAHVLGVREVHIGIKASFTKEIERLSAAVEEMTAAGLSSGVDFVLVEGPDEYLFGEEKALLNVLDGAGPLPREAHYPPYEWGLRPTLASPNPALVNNVETYAHVPSIVRHGGDDFRELGTANTPGTVIFTVSGDVRRPGIYEREAGISLRELFEEVAGGPREGRTFKAALSGVANAVIPAERFDTAADFDSLGLIGAGLGSAGFVVMDDTASMPRVTQTVTRFLAVETCNQCTSCMHGLRTASRALDRLFDPATERHGEELRRAVDGARAAPHENRCYLPVQASKMIPSLVQRYREEFEALADGEPDAGIEYPIPKLVDFLEEEGRFVYDERQQYKQFDWSYVLPEPPAEPPRVSRPANQATGGVSVPLSPELTRELEALAEEADSDLDEYVARALTEWVKARSS